MGKREAMQNLVMIKVGWAGKIRLFFSVLSCPWQAVQTLLAFGEELAAREAELVDAKEKLAESLCDASRLKMEISALKLEGRA